MKPFTEEEILFMLTDGRIVGWRLFDSDGPVDFLSEVHTSFNLTRLYMSI